MIAERNAMMRGARRVFHNWSFLVAARGVGLVSSVLFVLLVTRKLGPFGYGQYAFVLTFTSYFAFLSEFSLDRVVIQRVAARGVGAGVYLLDSLVARLGLSCLAILGILNFMGRSARPELSTAIVIAGGLLLTSSLYNAFSALFRAFERMELVALIEIPYALVRSVAGAVVVVAGFGLLPLLAVFLIVDLLRALIGLMVFLRAFRPSLAPPRLTVIWSLIRSGVPLTLWLLGATVEFRTNVIVLARYWDDSVVGWYSASYKVIDLISVMVLAVSSAMLPALCRLYAKSRDQFVIAYSQVLRLLVIVLLPLAIGTTILADRLVVLLFGQSYLNAAPSLQLLIWVAVVMSMQYVCGTAVLATGQWSRVPILASVVAGTAILAAILFIPRLGHVGAALALLVTEIVNLCATYVFVWRSTGVRPRHLGLGRLVLSLGLWSVLLWLLRDVSAFIVVACAIPLYALLVTLSGVLRPEDFQLVKALLPRRAYAWVRPGDAEA